METDDIWMHHHFTLQYSVWCTV